jgi:hypothetical protein
MIAVLDLLDTPPDLAQARRQAQTRTLLASHTGEISLLMETNSLIQPHYLGGTSFARRCCYRQLSGDIHV